MTQTTKDSFYSAENMAHLKKAKPNLDNGKRTEHELIEGE